MGLSCVYYGNDIEKNMPNGSHLLQLHKCNGCSPLILSPNMTIALYE